MRAFATLTLIAAICWPAFAQAEDIRVGFAPPVDRDLAYHIEQRRPVAGRMTRFTADRTLRFTNAGKDGGYTLVVTLRAIDTDATGDGGEPYRAALSPLIGVALQFRLDRDGHIVALDNMAEAWPRIEATLHAATAREAPDTARHRAAANVLALFDGQSPEGKLALLSGEIQPLLLFASSTIDDAHPRGLRTVAGSPLGRPVAVEGTVAVAGRTGGMLDIAENLTGPGTRVEVHYRLSQASGLVSQQRRLLELGDRTLTETRDVKGVED